LQENFRVYEKETKMDAIWLYVLGAIGALIAIYARSEDPIPPFRALYDYSEDETELTDVRKKIKQATLKRENLSTKYESNELKNDQFKNLAKEYDDRIGDLEKTRAFLDTKIQKAQILHRLLGFVVYILLGGMFAGLLSNFITVEGLEGQISDIAKPILIGATWTSYLSVLGFRNEEKQKQEAEKKAVAVSDTAVDEIARLKDSVTNAVSKLQETAQVQQWGDGKVDDYLDDFFFGAEDAKHTLKQDQFD